MQEIEFNLLTEPWVRVRLPDNAVQEVSLTDALVHAQEYMDLAGEMPTQDAAMLRLLLAVLFTVFSRVNEVGEPLEDEEAALERWGALWELKHFPEQPIRDYLEQWKDRFWLFHPERPFWQVPEAKIGSPFKGGKLNGEVFESENKNNMFASYAGVEKNALTYAQAARWLVFLNNYDDAAAKKKAKDRPSMSPGWLGQLGLVYVKGVNLFETLMRNLMFLNDRAELWEKGRPNWELEEPRSEERTEIVCPGNYAELLTMQCRRIWLERENEKVVRYTLLGGDFFDKKNAFAEPMTLWGLRKQTKESPECYLPQKHDMEKMLWREFSSIIDDGKHIPGVVQWNGYLQRCGFLKKKEILQICAVGVEYGAQSASMKGVYAVQNEYDYFTAVDDCPDSDNAGAGHLGTVEYNSATLYRYATVNVMELERHLGAEKAAEVVRSFGEAFIRSMPTGKQNTFANRTLPDAVYVTIREDQPVNLCGAFERAVRKSAEGYAEPSKSALQAYAQQLYQSFAEAPAKSFTVGTGLEALAPAQPLNTMLDALEEAVKENLTGNEVE